MSDCEVVTFIPGPTLALECWSDELSPAQLAAYDRAGQEHNDIRSKLGEIVKDSENIFSGEIFSAYHISGEVSKALEQISKPLSEVKAARQQKLKEQAAQVTQTRLNTRSEKKSYAEEIIDDDDEEDYMPLAKRSAKVREQREREKREKNTKTKEKSRNTKTSTPSNKSYLLSHS